MCGCRRKPVRDDDDPGTGVENSEKRQLPFSRGIERTAKVFRSKKHFHIPSLAGDPSVLWKHRVEPKPFYCSQFVKRTETSLSDRLL